MIRIVAIFLLLAALPAMATEVTDFKPRPAAAEQDGKTYVGILVSEAEFRKILQYKIDTNAKVAECSVDKRVCTQLQETYKLSITKLEDRLRKNNSWFERNRGTLGIFTGLVVGASMSVAIVYGVYQK